jgi:hypothetical protein
MVTRRRRIRHLLDDFGFSSDLDEKGNKARIYSKITNTAEAIRYIRDALDAAGVESRNDVVELRGTFASVIRLKDAKPSVIYVKYENSDSYWSIGEEVEALRGKKAKTVSQQVLDHLRFMSTKAWIIFFDKWGGFQYVTYESFMSNSYPLTQKSNGEAVRAIDLDILKRVPFLNIV